jgi:WD40 repeat protein
VKVRVWNASTGAPIRTSLTFADGVLIGSAWISPDGALLALQKSDHRIEFWNTASGRLVSTTSSSVAGNSQPAAWAPNSQFLAIGLPNPHWPSVPSEVQVWSAATGQLIATFSDSDTFEGTIGGLAWSEDGKYLAESSGQIHVWDVSARQLVATFGKVEKSSWIIAVSWAPDGSKLASLTANVTRSPHMQNRLSVWQLL